jgi:AhpD family alkylhydroperoxidase
MHLVELRASQMNFCAFCVKMHIADARKDGETDARLDRLIVWRFVDDFSDAEKAALAWTEALTTLDQTADLASIRADLRTHFNPKQIGALTMLIAQINLWNRVQRSVY